MGKVCTICKLPKPLDEFTPKDHRCRECNRERARKWREANRERVREINRDYVKRNPGAKAAATRRWEAKNPEAVAAMRKQRIESGKQAAAHKRWVAKNREHVREMKRKYNEANRERNTVARMEWARRNPEKTRIAAANRYGARKARKQQGGVFVVLDREIRRLKASPCANCSSPGPIHIDHVIPLSRGGRHSIGNLQPLCQPCNNRKYDHLMIEWKATR